MKKTMILAGLVLLFSMSIPAHAVTEEEKKAVAIVSEFKAKTANQSLERVKAYRKEKCGAEDAEPQVVNGALKCVKVAGGDKPISGVAVAATQKLTGYCANSDAIGKVVPCKPEDSEKCRASAAAAEATISETAK